MRSIDDSSPSFDALLSEINRACGWEYIPHDKIPALAKLCGPAEVERLIRLLDELDDADLVDDAGDGIDEYWRLRTSYSAVLGLVGEPAVEPLLRALDSSNPKTRGYVARALGGIGNPRAFDPIVAMLADDRNEDIRSDLITALGLLGDERAVSILLPYLNTQEQNRSHTICFTAEALGRISAEAAIEPLAAILASDPDWHARYGAAKGLRMMKQRSAREALRTIESDSDERVRALGRGLRPMTRRLYLTLICGGLATVLAGVAHGLSIVGSPDQGLVIPSLLIAVGFFAMLTGVALYVERGFGS